VSADTRARHPATLALREGSRARARAFAVAPRSGMLCRTLPPAVVAWQTSRERALRR
jgi:hypothetical protein